MAALVGAQLAPGLRERGAVRRDVGEVPVQAALGHRRAAAQPVDFQRLDAFFGEDREAGLDPVVDPIACCLSAIAPAPYAAAYDPRYLRKLTQMSVLTSHRNMTVNAGPTFSRAGHMFYCSRTTEIFSVRSSAVPCSVERARQRSKASAAVPIGDL